MSSDDNNSTDHYEGALLEEINDRLKGIQEGQASLVTVPTDITKLKLDMADVKANINIIKTAVIDHTRNINSLDTRVSTLEKSRA